MSLINGKFYMNPAYGQAMATKDPAVAADVHSLQKAAKDPKVGDAHENCGTVQIRETDREFENTIPT
ncbi:MAG: hypothetical protein ABSB66_14855 [Candidatus Acidiferrales bacterium]|jgi:hypothetical protein